MARQAHTLAHTAEAFVYQCTGKMQKPNKRQLIPGTQSVPCWWHSCPVAHKRTAWPGTTAILLDTYCVCMSLQCASCWDAEHGTQKCLIRAQRVWVWASCHLAPSQTSLAGPHLRSWLLDSRALSAQYQAALSTLQRVVESANLGRLLWQHQGPSDKECAVVLSRRTRSQPPHTMASSFPLWGGRNFPGN